MQPYPTIQNYANYQPMPQPYPDRLAQLQNQYQQSVNIPQQMPVPQVNQGLLWVQGEAGAKSYLVAPNTTVLLLDSEGQKFYLKSTDGAGMPSLRVFEYTEVSQNASQALHLDEKTLSDKYVTRDEYEGLKRLYDTITERLNGISSGTAVESGAKSKSKERGGKGNEQSDI